MEAIPVGRQLRREPDELLRPESAGPSTVGCFPGGASPFGCEEMSGNVWEWTRSLDKAFPYVRRMAEKNQSTFVKPPCRARRLCFFVIRLARGACRPWGEPVFRVGVIGFRVVVLPFSSGL